jgi:regulator of replication initiation timing
MNIYCLSPQNVPPNPVLFPNLIPTFTSQGHSVVDTIADADIVLFDLHTRISDYDQRDIDFILQNNVFVCSFCEWDRGNLSNDLWPMPLTPQQSSVMNKIYHSGVHFCRLLNAMDTHPANLYPYEKSIYYEEKLCTLDELFNRAYDVCFIANQSPSRDRIAKALESDRRLNCIISIGKPKIPFDNFVNIHRTAKLFVSSGAGGYTDERKQCLFSVAGLLQENTDQLLSHPFKHRENCLKISSEPTREELDTIYEVVNDKDRLFEIYKNGYDYMKQYYSAEYIANDILTKILKHHA